MWQHDKLIGFLILGSITVFWAKYNRFTDGRVTASRKHSTTQQHHVVTNFNEYAKPNIAQQHIVVIGNRVRATSIRRMQVGELERRLRPVKRVTRKTTWVRPEWRSTSAARPASKQASERALWQRPMYARRRTALRAPHRSTYRRFSPATPAQRWCAIPRNAQSRIRITANRIQNSWANGLAKGKVFPYSLPSVGPGADPGVQAFSPQVTCSESRHRPGSRLPLLSVRPAVTSVAFTRWRYL